MNDVFHEKIPEGFTVIWFNNYKNQTKIDKDSEFQKPKNRETPCIKVGK